MANAAGQAPPHSPHKIKWNYVKFPEVTAGLFKQDFIVLISYMFLSNLVKLNVWSN